VATAAGRDEQNRSSHTGCVGLVFHDGRLDEGGLRLRFVRESSRRVDPDLAGEVAARFQTARNDHTNAIVRAAYDQLERQSVAIFTQLTNPDRPLFTGLRVEFTRCENPYNSDDELIGAVRTDGVLEITTSAANGTAVILCWAVTSAERTTYFEPFTTSLDMWCHASASTGTGNTKHG
jgi:hypothetical protein